MDEQIPDEILREIFLQLPEKKIVLRAKTLSSICMVSKRFRAIAESVLYQSFELYTESYRTRIRLYLRTMLDRPDLAAQVKSFNAQPWPPGPCIEGEHQEHDNESTSESPLAQQLVKASMSFPFPDDPMAHRDWVHALQTGVEDADNTLLLAMLPNIRSLDIGLSWETRDKCFLYSLTNQAAKQLDYSAYTSNALQLPHTLGRTPHVLRKLKTLTFATPREMHTTTVSSADLLCQMLRLCNVESLRVYGRLKFKPEHWTFKDGRMPVKTLHLIGSSFDEDMIAYLLSRCDDLVEFRWSLTFGDLDSISWETLWGLLKLHKHSLRSIRTRLDRKHDPNTYGFPPLEHPITFTDFTALRRLEIAESVLLPPERELAYTALDPASALLPQSLETLLVHQASKALIEAVGYIRDELHGDLPLLRKVCAVPNWSDATVNIWTRERGYEDIPSDWFPPFDDDDEEGVGECILNGC